MRAVWIVALLVACGGRPEAPQTDEPDHVSPCGMRVFGVAETPEEFAAVESEVVGLFADRWAGCGLLSGVAVAFDPTLKDRGYGDLFVPYETTLYLDGAPIRTSGAFAHGLVHVMDWADNSGTAGLDHEGWKETGILDRLNDWTQAQVYGKP
jgi:hypothetical protein